jgi:hypothetical protein
VVVLDVVAVVVVVVVVVVVSRETGGVVCRNQEDLVHDTTAVAFYIRSSL